MRKPPKSHQSTPAAPGDEDFIGPITPEFAQQDSQLRAYARIVENFAQNKKGVKNTIYKENLIQYEHLDFVSTDFIADVYGFQPSDVSLAANEPSPFQTQAASKDWRGGLKLVHPGSFLKYVLSAQAGALALKPVWIAISKVSNFNNPRKLSIEYVNEIIEILKNGGVRDPIVVAQDIISSEHRLVDGQHRMEAERLRGRTHILAYVIPGGYTFAAAASVYLNCAHGRPLKLNAAVPRALEALRLYKMMTGREGDKSVFADRYHVTVQALNAEIKRNLADSGQLDFQYLPKVKRRQYACDHLLRILPRLETVDTLKGDFDFELGLKALRSLTVNKRLRLT